MAAALQDIRSHNSAYEKFPDGPDAYRQGGVDAALQRLFQAAVAHAQSRLEWYDRKAGSKGKLARRLRGWALLLFAIGTLAPILLTLLYQLAKAFGNGKTDQLAVVDVIAKVPLAEVGFVSLGLAGALVVFDQFFDISGTWIRFRQAQARLEVLLADLRFAWAGLLVSSGGSFADRTTALAAVSLLRDFVGQVEQLAETETREWADRFRSRISAFDGNSSLKVRLDPVDGERSRTPHASKEGLEARNEQRPQPQPTPASQLGIVRVVIDQIEELDGGSVKLTVDSTERPVPADGVVMLTLELEKRHLLAAEANRAGTRVHAELEIEPTASSDSRSYTLVLMP